MKSVHLHCLLVSPDPELAWRLRHLLGQVQQLHFTLQSAPQPEATTIYDMKRFDLLLLEIGPDQMEWIAEFRALYPELPIVALTSLPDDELGLLVLREGAHDYLCLENLSSEVLLRTLRYTQERHRVEKAFRLSQRQMFQTQKMEAIGRTASGLSHQFRQSVQVVFSNTSALVEMHSKDPETVTLAKEIETAVHSANRLVDQFMDFARGQNSGGSSCLNRVIERHLEMLNSMAEGHHLDVRLDQGELRVGAPRSEIAQLLFNLLGNSVDASEPGGQLQICTQELNLDTSYREGALSLSRGRYAVLTVGDSGNGIEAELRDRIFEPFFTTKRKGRDSGLGLATAFNFCQRYGVGLDLWSEVGLGTAIRLVFSLEGGLPDSTAPTALELDSHRVLLWTEDTRLMLTLRNMLGSHGSAVLEVHSMEDILAVEKSGDSHVLVVDTATYAKQEKALSQVRNLLLLSPWSGRPPLETTPELVLACPFSREALLRTLQGLFVPLSIDPS